MVLADFVEERYRALQDVGSHVSSQGPGMRLCLYIYPSIHIYIYIYIYRYIYRHI